MNIQHILLKTRSQLRKKNKKEIRFNPKRFDCGKPAKELLRQALEVIIDIRPFNIYTALLHTITASRLNVLHSLVQSPNCKGHPDIQKIVSEMELNEKLPKIGYLPPFKDVKGLYSYAGKGSSEDIHNYCILMGLSVRQLQEQVKYFRTQSLQLCFPITAYRHQ